MTPKRPTDETLRTLLDAACSDVLTDEQFGRLEAALSASEDARREYLRYFTLTGELRYLLSMAHADAAARERTGMEYAAGDHLADKPRMPPQETSPGVPFPVGIFRGMADGLLWEWTRAYLSAAVILGLFLLAASFIYVSHTVPIDRAGQLAENKAAPPTMEFVGRITGMVDCKFSDDKDILPPPSSNAYVPLGRKYKLDSGLMEITYDSGAKVILQGPCTYEVESTAGGYLALGKLTARVGARGGGRGTGKSGSNQKSEIRNQKSPSSFILHPSSLFSVRTPTAVVTDLGTEFGVEVSKRGRTKTQVFDGSVRLAVIAPSGEAGEGRVLSVGQTGVVQSGNAAIVVADADGSKTFARVMPPPKDVQKARADAYAELVMSLGPVAYYRMERPTDEKELLTVFDSASGGRHGKLSGVGRAGGLERLWRPGRFGGGLEFRGEFFGDYVIAPRTPDSDSNQYSFAAWVLTDDRESWWPHLAIDGGSHSQSRFKIALGEDEGYLYASVAPTRGERGLVREHPPNLLPTGQWQHVAVVADGSTIHLYRNGVEKAANRCDGVIASPPGKYLLLGCNNMAKDPTGLVPASFWDGRIDEVAIFDRALSLEEIKCLYKGPAKLQDRGERTKGK